MSIYIAMYIQLFRCLMTDRHTGNNKKNKNNNNNKRRFFVILTRMGKKTF